METGDKNISFRDTEIYGGFWRQKQEMVADTTIRAVYDRFEETGRFKAFSCGWREGMVNKPHIFWDSDVAKWIESAAYILEKKKDPWLEEIVDRVVDQIEKNRDPEGYFNIYFLNIEPSKRFTARTDHELYCAGHLFEAAIAYYRATGKDKFLRLMCDYADYIEKVFVKEGSARFKTPGHEEIELALVKLHHCTGEKRYLELSKFFIDQRGKTAEESYQDVKPSYNQSHLPVREQTTAEGHAVRAAYLYAGMADIAREYGDSELLNACRKIFDNIVNRRMYVTGGTGSSHVGEAFTVDYDLPNVTAYTETCSAIALCLFADRMSLADHDSIYANTAETAMYNGVMSGISLDGKSFFYCNPLEIRTALIGRDASHTRGDWLPEIQRQEVFGCSCCPPNITRFIASAGDRLYTADGGTVYVNHYTASRTSTLFNGKRLKLSQKTDYPFDGKVSFTCSYPDDITLAFRIPGWCEKYTVKVDGAPAELPVRRGYAYLKACGKVSVSLNFWMDVCFVEANPNVQENSGRYAVRRGPVVYCAESVDNGVLLRDIRVDAKAKPRIVQDAFIGAPVIVTRGERREGFDALYRRAKAAYVPCEVRLIPYFAFANRGACDMLVWLQAYNL